MTIITHKRPLRLKAKRKPAKRAGEWWSQRVTQDMTLGIAQRSDAMTQPKVFSGDDPKAMARSLKRSVESSQRRKVAPYRSAMSMLTFYINRAGKRLPKRRLQVLEKAKGELRTLFHRTTGLDRVRLNRTGLNRGSLKNTAAAKAHGTQRKAGS